MYTSIRTVGRSILSSRCTNPLLTRLGGAFYSSEGALTKEDVEKRILDLLKGFDKVKAEKVIHSLNVQVSCMDEFKGTYWLNIQVELEFLLKVNANFSADLGLDSLDVVEVVMAIEEEFFLEIPDQVADNIKSPKDAVEYILKAKQ